MLPISVSTTLTALFLPTLLAGGFAACSASSSPTSSDDAGSDVTTPTVDGGDDDATFTDEDATAGDGSARDGGDAGAGDAGKKDGSGGDAQAKDSGTADAAKECGTAPALHTTPTEGVFCPFQADSGAADASAACPSTPGEHCCIYPKAANKPATCNTVAQGCDGEIDAGGSDFACDEPADCVGGQVCCLDGIALKDPVCYYFGSKVRQTKCRIGGCNAGELTVCSAQADCATGTCTAMDTKGKELGVCVP